MIETMHSFVNIQPIVRPIINVSNSGSSTNAPITDLFLNNENGAWFDLSDKSMLFHTIDGITPVTGPGQPVGLVLDKRFDNTRGPEINNVSILSNTWVNNGGKYTSTATTANLRIGTANDFIIGMFYEFRIVVEEITGGNLVLRIRGGVINTAITAPGTYTLYGPAGTSGVAGAGVTFTGTAGQYAVVSGLTLLSTKSSNTLRQSSSSRRPLYQEDELGIGYLSFDGIDDALTLSNLDLSTTDKVTVLVGNYINGTGSQVLMEHSPNFATNNGTFAIIPYDAGANSCVFAWRGSGAYGYGSFVNTEIAPSTKFVLSGVIDLGAIDSNDIVLPRVNSVDTSFIVNVPSMGGGNFMLSNLYVGSRAGSTVNYNGRFYQIVLRNNATSDAELTNAESFIANKLGM